GAALWHGHHDSWGAHRWVDGAADGDAAGVGAGGASSSDGRGGAYGGRTRRWRGTAGHGVEQGPRRSADSALLWAACDADDAARGAGAWTAASAAGAGS